MRFGIKNNSLAFLLLFLLVFVQSIHAIAATDSADARAQEIAIVEGFRSAQFGMTEAEVKEAVLKDFSIDDSGIERQVHPTEKTSGLSITVKNIVAGAGPARVSYVFGHTTKKLIQVNILWGKLIDPDSNPQGLVTAANSLRIYFAQRGFKKDDLVMNARLKDGSVLVFRGTDKDGRMVVLLLHNPQNPQEKEEDEASVQDLSLRLSYISDPVNPDVFRIKPGDF